VFKEKEVSFAGLVVNGSGFTIDPKISEALSKFPVPTTITDVRSFHGLANQLTNFDPQLARKLEPMRHLLKSKTT
jgi:hypothetical protein